MRTTTRQACPITGSEDTELVATFSRCITSDGRLMVGEVENRISRVCGLIFNAAGARGQERIFFGEEYDLHGESAESELACFDGGEVRGIYDSAIEFIEKGTNLAEKGRVLDIGCGKGRFLERFAGGRPAWRMYGVEPSRNAWRFASRLRPNVEIFRGEWEDSPFVDQEFDLVVANGVLEHVPSPVDFLRKFRRCLAEGGIGFIGVPNFETNPTDLFTFDHLSRFTPSTIRLAFGLAGLAVLHRWVSPTRVPMWFVVTRGAVQGFDAEGLYAEGRRLIDGAMRFIEAMFASYERCVEGARHDQGGIAMYGVGAVGALGTAYTSLKPEMLTCFVDDNRSIWGSERLGVRIRNPEEIHELGVRHVVIGANPCYVRQMAAKMRGYGGGSVRVYGPEGNGS